MMNDSDRCPDNKYYFSDGNLTILVSKTLFKVHRHVLSRDGSTFENMFSLDADMEPQTGIHKPPSEKFTQDGSSDENPIHVQGDTADEFRDLLWSLYALPQEIVAAMSSQDDIVKLSNIARMAHKYHFISTESWALHALLTCLQSPSPTALETNALIQVTEAAVLCGNNPLLDDVRLRWRGLIGGRKDLGVAVNVMERLEIQDLRGLAYHAMLLQGREAWEKEPSLTREQRIRLLSGHYNLIKVCDALPNTPPEFVHDPECDHGPEICNEYWLLLWQGMMSLDPDRGTGSQAIRHHKLDIVGRLMMAVSIMMAFDEETFPKAYEHEFLSCDECIKPALDATVALCRKTQEELMHFFQDVA